MTYRNISDPNYNAYAERWGAIRDQHVEEYDLRAAAKNLTLAGDHEAAQPLLLRLQAIYHQMALNLNHIIELGNRENRRVG